MGRVGGDAVVGRRGEEGVDRLDVAVEGWRGGVGGPVGGGEVGDGAEVVGRLRGVERGWERGEDFGEDVIVGAARGGRGERGSHREAYGEAGRDGGSLAVIVRGGVGPDEGEPCRVLDRVEGSTVQL